MKKRLTILICLIISLQVYSADYSMNEMPMYDGKHTPTVPENLRMSEGAVRLGWKYYYQGDYKTAIKRFNQAWMFNRKSVGAFYGFGLVMGQRARKEEAVKNLKASILYLTKANEYSLHKDYKIITDLAYSHTMLATILVAKGKSDNNHFKIAETLFIKSKALKADYPLTYALWSTCEFYQKRYSQAKKLLNEAKKLGYKPDQNYQKDLNNKMK